MSSIPQGSVLGPVLLKIFINYINNWIKCNFSKFTNNTKLYSAVNTVEGMDAIQRDLKGRPL